MLVLLCMLSLPLVYLFARAPRRISAHTWWGWCWVEARTWAAGANRTAGAACPVCREPWTRRLLAPGKGCFGELQS